MLSGTATATASKAARNESLFIGSSSVMVGGPRHHAWRVLSAGGLPGHSLARPFAEAADPDHSTSRHTLCGTTTMLRFRPREHSITADLDRLKEVRDFVEDAAAEFGFDADARYEVKLALSEAVSNAIRHGSRSPQDPVRILAVEEAGALVFEVVDTGSFVPRVGRGSAMPESGRGPGVI